MSDTGKGFKYTPVTVAVDPDQYGALLEVDAQGRLKTVVSGGASGGTSAEDESGFTAGATFGTPIMGADLSGNELLIAAIDPATRRLLVDPGSAGGGTAVVDESTFTPATTSLTPVGGARLDAPSDVANGDAGVARITPQRGLHSNLRKNDGTELGIVTAPLRTDPTGTTTQPVSAASLPLPSGAATSAKQDTEIASLASIDGKIPAQGQALMAASSPVVIASNQSAVPVSASALPLPSGAATEATLSSLNGKVTAVNTGAVVVSSSALPSGASTAAKQPALGTAGTASADVLTVQGIASMTALKVDGSAVTQPVSGTFWQATQPVSAASLPLPSGAATLAEQQSQTTALQIMDDWDESDRAKVNIIVGQAGVTAGAGAVAANTPRVTHASDDPVVTSLQIIDDWDETDRAKVNIIVGQAGVDGNSGNKSAATQRVVLATDQPALTNPLLVQPQAATTGGGTPYKLISAASTNATSVKGSAGQVYAIAVFNLNASARYLKLYNKASAPTVGTDTPVQTYMIPGNAAGAGLTLSIPVGMAFGTGIAFALTTGIADADTGAVAASEICVNLVYL